MKLEKVIIDNFRSIKHCEIHFGELTAIVGENNAGKTAVLRALNAVFNYDDEKLYFQDDTHQHFVRTITKIFLYFSDVPERTYYNDKTFDNGNLVLRFSYSYSRTNHKPSLECLKPTSTEKLEMDFLSDLKKDFNFIYVPANRGDDDLKWNDDSIFAKLVSEYLKLQTRNRDILSSKIAKESKHIHDQALKKLETELSGLKFLDDFHNYAIDYTESIDYTIFLRKLGLWIKENSGKRAVTEYGSGVKSLTVIALYRMLASINNISIMLGIEEPETNLHPQAQKKFISVLKEKRQECETQAVFTTHSTVIIDELEHDDIVLVRREKDSRREFISHITQLPDDFWEKYDIEQLKHYNFFKYRNSDFFFSKYVVLAESTTDAQFIENLLKPVLKDNIYCVVTVQSAL